MNWLLYLVALFFVLELIDRLQVIFLFRNLLKLFQKSHRVILNNSISDHWKEVVLPHYAMLLIINSLKGAGYLIFSLTPLLIVYLLGGYFSWNIEKIILSWEGIFVATVGAPLYYSMRYRISRKIKSPNQKCSFNDVTNYSLMERFLHRLLLASPIRSEVAFDLECALIPVLKTDFHKGKHVFVAGLARAGTTILMRAIHESGSFVSLTYRDMPYVMAPNLGQKINHFSPRSIGRHERAHGDRIMVDFDSPEALEEVFWRTFCGNDYIKNEALVHHKPNLEIISKFRVFVSHVLTKYEGERYLSKNNNNILRLSAIRNAFPNSIIIVPFRDPLEHAYSLLRQHQRFSSASDHFTREYMGWLVHHEFGQDHRPFFFGKEIISRDLCTIDYWLLVWLTVYQYLLQLITSNQVNVVPVAYEDLCEKNNKTWKQVCELVALPVSKQYFKRIIHDDIPEPNDLQILRRTKEIYDELYQISGQYLGQS